MTGVITLSLSASHSSGVAPLAVFFDATDTTTTVTNRPFHDVEYRWDFGDAASGTWNAGSRPGVSSRNSATGPVAAHVFESPGTYTVTLTAFAGINTVSSQVQITVQDPNVVFSGVNTICFSTSGNFTGAPAGFCTAPGATAITSSDFVKVTTYAATGKRLLLHRGETWTAAAPAAIVNAGPGILGAFGSGSRPIVKATGNTTILRFSSGNTPNISDWRVMDLELDGSMVSPATNSVFGVEGGGGINQLTLLRLSIHDTHQGISFSDDLLNYLVGIGAGGAPGHVMWDQIAVVDSTISHMVGGGGGYGTYLSAQRFSYLGNVVDDTTSAEHVLRTPYLRKGVISDNTLSRPAAGKHTIKLHGPTWSNGQPPTGVTSSGYSELIVISDNKIVGGPSGADITAWLGPQDNGKDERLRDIIVERNWFVSGAGTQYTLVISGVEQTIRNNIFDLSGNLFHNGLTVELRGIEPPPNYVRVYNNTFYSHDSGDFYGVTLLSTASNTTVENNLGSAPNATSPVLVYNKGSSNLAQSNNLLNNAPGTLFITATPSVPTDFKLVPGTPAIDGGLAIPVFSDFFRQSRPNGGAIDIGGAEF